MALQESGEMYLETILVLRQKQGSVRSIDIAHHMAFSKPSVSRAVGILKSGGFIEIDELGQITLTPAGEEIAESVYEKHRVITRFLLSIGVDDKTAEEDACRIEHVISEQTFECIRAEYKKRA